MGRRLPSMRWADVYVPHVSPASMSPASMRRCPRSAPAPSAPARVDVPGVDASMSPASIRWADVYVSGLGPREAPMAERLLVVDAMGRRLPGVDRAIRKRGQQEVD